MNPIDSDRQCLDGAQGLRVDTAVREGELISAGRKEFWVGFGNVARESAIFAAKMLLPTIGYKRIGDGSEIENQGEAGWIGVKSVHSALRPLQLLS